MPNRCRSLFHLACSRQRAEIVDYRLAVLFDTDAARSAVGRLCKVENGSIYPHYRLIELGQLLGVTGDIVPDQRSARSVRQVERKAATHKGRVAGETLACVRPSCA